jgi:hypothetical protein
MSHRRFPFCGIRRSTAHADDVAALQLSEERRCARSWATDSWLRGLRFAARRIVDARGIFTSNSICASCYGRPVDPRRNGSQRAWSAWMRSKKPAHRDFRQRWFLALDRLSSHAEGLVRVAAESKDLRRSGTTHPLRTFAIRAASVASRLGHTTERVECHGQATRPSELVLLLFEFGQRAPGVTLQQQLRARESPCPSHGRGQAQGGTVARDRLVVPTMHSAEKRPG